MTQRQFKPYALLFYKGEVRKTHIILESDRALYTSFGTFLQLGARWLWVRDLECELKPERINEPANQDRQSQPGGQADASSALPDKVPR